MSIAKALTIPGWMQPEELEWLANQAQTHQLIVEVGCARGRSTRALAENTSGIVFALDDFRGAREDCREEIPELQEDFLRNMEGLLNVRMLKIDHSERIPDLHPDMVFIDGSHLYEHAKRNIQLWLSCIQPNGLLCGHDYHIGFPGVMQAVNECFRRIELGAGSIWIGKDICR